jgi:sugar phosphate isomerase/epimerase
MKIGIDIPSRDLYRISFEEKLRKLGEILKGIEEIHKLYPEVCCVEIGLNAWEELFKQREEGFEVNWERVEALREVLRFEWMNLFVHGTHIMSKYRWELTDFHNLSSFDQVERNFSVDLTAKQVELTRFLGGRIFVLHPGFLYRKKTAPEKKGEIKTKLKRWMGIAKQNFSKSLRELLSKTSKVDILVENMELRLDEEVGYLLDNPEEVHSLILEIGSPRLGIAYDTGHAHLAALYYGYDEILVFRKIVDRCKLIHFHDNFGRPGIKDYEKGIGDLHSIPFVEGGNVPLKEILQIAARSKVSPALVYECRFKREELMKSLERIREVLKS